jgi:hypothetical protein
MLAMLGQSTMPTGAVGRSERVVPTEHDVTPLVRRDIDDAPEPLTTMERKAKEKGETINNVGLDAVNALVGGEMITFAKAG